MRKIFFNIFVLVFIAFGIHCLATYAFPFRYQAFTRMKSLGLLQHGLAAQNDIVFFGDSVSYWVAGDDKNKRTLVEMFQKRVAPLQVTHVYHGAAHAGIFEKYVSFIGRYARKHNQKPPVVIFPVNMRSFSLEWDLRPEYQFAKSMYIIDYSESWWFPYLARFFAAFKIFNLQPIVEQDYLHMPVHLGDKQIGLVSEFIGRQYKRADPQKIRKKIIFHYLYPLSGNHRKIQSFLRIAAFCRREEIPVLFYISPVDYEKGREQLGEDFMNQFQKNLTVLKNVFDQEEVVYVDMSQDLPSAAFDYKDYPNEHLKQQGRRRVVAKLVRALRARNILPRS